MRKVIIGVGSIVAVGAIALAAIYFRSHGISGAPPAGQSHWVPAPLSPVNHALPRKQPRPQASLIKQFGPWRLTCMRREKAPKVGVIQNFGIVPGEAASKPSPCQA